MTGKNKPTHLVAHLHFLPTQKPNKKMQKSYQTNAPRQTQMTTNKHDRKEGRSANRVDRPAN